MLAVIVAKGFEENIAVKGKGCIRRFRRVQRRQAKLEVKWKISSSKYGCSSEYLTRLLLATSETVSLNLAKH